MGKVTKYKHYFHKQYLHWHQIRRILNMVDMVYKLRTKKEGLRIVVCQILPYISCWIITTVLWGGYSYSSPKDTKTIRRIRHVAQGHTISYVVGSNFKTKFACSENCLHSTKTEWICFRETFWEKCYYQS